MRALVDRQQKVGGEFRSALDGVPRESQLTISDNWAQLCGPKFRHIATGQVQSTSIAYPGASYHISVLVMVEVNANFGTYRLERWTVKVLDVAQ